MRKKNKKLRRLLTIVSLSFFFNLSKLTNLINQNSKSMIFINFTYKFDFYKFYLSVRTVEELDILAQASRSHLSESTRNPLWFWFALLLRRRAHVLSEKTSCSGEEVSPKREHAKTSLFHSSSSRLGERSSPEREDLSPGRGLLA